MPISAPHRAAPGTVDISHPAFALAALVVLTVVPYLYPFTWNVFTRVRGIDEHLALAAVFTTTGIGIALAYQILVQPGRAAPLPDPTAEFLTLLHGLARVFLWISVVANIGLVAYVMAFFSGDLLALKERLLDLEGVNILTQSFLLFLGPFIHISLLRGTPYVRDLVALGCIVAVRAALLSERVALFEFLVPLAVVLSQHKVLRVTPARLTAFVLFVPAFFVLTELFRSFSAKFVGSGDWSGLDPWFIVGWNLERFFIYYADTVDKLYFVIDHQFFFSTQGWFDGIARIAARLGFLDIASLVAPDLMDTALVYGARHPEMTNPGGLASLMSDFGWGGIAVWLALLAGLLTGHARSQRGGLLALGLYPVFYITFTEMPRYIYIFQTRALFPLALYLMSYGLCLVLAGPFAGRRRAPHPFEA
jgi:hypothetical protein